MLKRLRRKGSKLPQNGEWQTQIMYLREINKQYSKLQ